MTAIASLITSAVTTTLLCVWQIILSTEFKVIKSDFAIQIFDK